MKIYHRKTNSFVMLFKFLRKHINNIICFLHHWIKMKKPVKKGRVGKTEDGKLVLINAEGKIFGADKTLLAIWQICDGTVGYEETTALRKLIGGVFVHHPPQCPVTVTAEAGHPLAAGVQPFTLQDEHYHMAYDAKNADLFMISESEHGTQPAGWTRTPGDGRVCVLTPGHNVEVWLHPSYQTLLGNALRWCAG